MNIFNCHVLFSLFSVCNVIFWLVDWSLDDIQCVMQHTGLYSVLWLWLKVTVTVKGKVSSLEPQAVMTLQIKNWLRNIKFLRKHWLKDVTFEKNELGGWEWEAESNHFWVGLSLPLSEELKKLHHTLGWGVRLTQQY